MLKRGWQFGALVVLVALAACAWSQTAAYAAPADSVGDDFSVYHQSLANAADMALANVAREAEISTQTDGTATDSTTQQDETILHQFAQQYWNGSDDAVRRAVERVKQLRPVLSPILHEGGIPDEIAALVLVESAGQSTAVSPKGARGIWQFMPDTARRYGLTVDSEIDDRLDVQKSTRAAARYLRDLHIRLGSWSLALAAYNAGEKIVQNAVLRAGSEDFALLDRKRLLPAETRAYVPAVFAASILLSDNSLPGSSAGRNQHGPTVLFANSAAYDQQ
jgi:soluble lytic murein transglycosylase-like protein